MKIKLLMFVAILAAVKLVFLDLPFTLGLATGVGPDPDNPGKVIGIGGPALWEVLIEIVVIACFIAVFVTKRRASTQSHEH